jgi:hypothetical protein
MLRGVSSFNTLDIKMQVFKFMAMYSERDTFQTRVSAVRCAEKVHSYESYLGIVGMC